MVDPVASYAIMILATLTPFPAEIAAAAVAMRHDFLQAALLIWSGAMTGALLSYALALRLPRLRAWLVRRPSVRAAEARLLGLGWLGILGLRLIPLVPFFALSLAAGLLRVPLGAYLRGTGLGIVPGTLVMTMIGRGLVGEGTGLLVAGLVGAVALGGLTFALRRRPAPAALSPAGRSSTSAEDPPRSGARP